MYARSRIVENHTSVQLKRHARCPANLLTSRKNSSAFAVIKKNMKDGVSIDFPCGCRLSPDRVFEELAKIVRWEFGKRDPEFTKRPSRPKVKKH